jgi:hypothetical protein
MHIPQTRSTLSQRKPTQGSRRTFNYNDLPSENGTKQFLAEIQIWKSLKLRGVNKPINQADRLVHLPDSTYGARVLAIAGPTNPKHILHTLSRLTDED